MSERKVTQRGASIGVARECLHDEPVSWDICGHVDSMPRGVDQINVDHVFKISPGA